jgi:hypothetical protein
VPPVSELELTSQREGYKNQDVQVDATSGEKIYVFLLTPNQKV